MVSNVTGGNVRWGSHIEIRFQLYIMIDVIIQLSGSTPSYTHPKIKIYTQRNFEYTCP